MSWYSEGRARNPNSRHESVGAGKQILVEAEGQPPLVKICPHRVERNGGRCAAAQQANTFNLPYCVPVLRHG